MNINILSVTKQKILSSILLIIAFLQNAIPSRYFRLIIIRSASIFCTETQYIYFAKKQILYVAGNNEHLKGAIANESNWHCA